MFCRVLLVFIQIVAIATLTSSAHASDGKSGKKSSKEAAAAKGWRPENSKWLLNAIKSTDPTLSPKICSAVTKNKADLTINPELINEFYNLVRDNYDPIPFLVTLLGYTVSTPQPTADDLIAALNNQRKRLSSEREQRRSLSASQFSSSQCQTSTVGMPQPAVNPLAALATVAPEEKKEADLPDDPTLGEFGGRFASYYFMGATQAQYKKGLTCFLFFGSEKISGPITREDHLKLLSEYLRHPVLRQFINPAEIISEMVEQLDVDSLTALLTLDNGRPRGFLSQLKPSDLYPALGKLDAHQMRPLFLHAIDSLTNKEPQIAIAAPPPPARRRSFSGANLERGSFDWQVSIILRLEAMSDLEIHRFKKDNSPFLAIPRDPNDLNRGYDILSAKDFAHLDGEKYNLLHNAARLQKFRALDVLLSRYNPLGLVNKKDGRGRTAEQIVVEGFNAKPATRPALAAPAVPVPAPGAGPVIPAPVIVPAPVVDIEAEARAAAEKVRAADARVAIKNLFPSALEPQKRSWFSWSTPTASAPTNEEKQAELKFKRRKTTERLDLLLNPNADSTDSIQVLEEAAKDQDLELFKQIRDDNNDCLPLLRNSTVFQAVLDLFQKNEANVAFANRLLDYLVAAAPFHTLKAKFSVNEGKRSKKASNNEYADLAGKLSVFLHRVGTKANSTSPSAAPAAAKNAGQQANEKDPIEVRQLRILTDLQNLPGAFYEPTQEGETVLVAPRTDGINPWVIGKSICTEKNAAGNDLFTLALNKGLAAAARKLEPLYTRNKVAIEQSKRRNYSALITRVAQIAAEAAPVTAPVSTAPGSTGSLSSSTTGSGAKKSSLSSMSDDPLNDFKFYFPNTRTFTGPETKRGDLHPPRLTVTPPPGEETKITPNLLSPPNPPTPSPAGSAANNEGVHPGTRTPKQCAEMLPHLPEQLRNKNVADNIFADNGTSKPIALGLAEAAVDADNYKALLALFKADRVFNYGFFKKGNRIRDLFMRHWAIHKTLSVSGPSAQIQQLLRGVSGFELSVDYQAEWQTNKTELVRLTQQLRELTRRLTDEATTRELSKDPEAIQAVVNQNPEFIRATELAIDAARRTLRSQAALEYFGRNMFSPAMTGGPLSPPPATSGPGITLPPAVTAPGPSNTSSLSSSRTDSDHTTGTNWETYIVQLPTLSEELKNQVYADDVFRKDQPFAMGLAKAAIDDQNYKPLLALFKADRDYGYGYFTREKIEELNRFHSSKGPHKFVGPEAYVDRLLYRMLDGGFTKTRQEYSKDYEVFNGFLTTRRNETKLLVETLRKSLAGPDKDAAALDDEIQARPEVVAKIESMKIYAQSVITSRLALEYLPEDRAASPQVPVQPVKRLLADLDREWKRPVAQPEESKTSSLVEESRRIIKLAGQQQRYKSNSERPVAGDDELSVESIDNFHGLTAEETTQLSGFNFAKTPAIGAHVAQGTRSTQLIVPVAAQKKLRNGATIKFAGIFSGIGAEGREIAVTAAESIRNMIFDKLNELSSEQLNDSELVGRKLLAAFNEGAATIESLDTALSGATTVMTVFIGEKGYTLNLGNSSAISGFSAGAIHKTIRLTSDHTPVANGDELERLAKRGGTVEEYAVDIKTGTMYKLDMTTRGWKPFAKDFDAQGRVTSLDWSGAPLTKAQLESGDFRVMAAVRDSEGNYFLKRSAESVAGQHPTGRLAVTRALGFSEMGPAIGKTPDLVILQLVEKYPEFGTKQGRNFLVLTSRGISKELTDEWITQYVRLKRIEGKTPNQIAEGINKAAFKKGCTDNMSTIVIFL